MGWLLAQVNVGHTLHPLDDPRMQGFVERMARTNGDADQAPGFVWRLQSEAGDATGLAVSDDPSFIINLSGWRSVEELARFVYRSEHRAVMALRRQWFRRHEGPYQCLWWVPELHRPAPAEALERLALMTRDGPTKAAFTFRQPFPPPQA
jgi:hypothetical protein